MHCEICGKTSVFGNKVAHDRMYINRRTPKKIKPNLQKKELSAWTALQGGCAFARVACVPCVRRMCRNNKSSKTAKKQSGLPAKGMLQNVSFCSIPLGKTVCEPDGARILHLFRCKTTLFLTFNA